MCAAADRPATASLRFRSALMSGKATEPSIVAYGCRRCANARVPTANATPRPSPTTWVLHQLPAVVAPVICLLGILVTTFFARSPALRGLA